MKRGLLLFSIIFLSALLLTSFVIAANETTNDSNGDIVVDEGDTSRTDVEMAYDCLKEKVNEDCSTSLEENIFTLLAIRKCKSEVLNEMDNDECWPDNGCKIKDTAQAILSLNKAGTNTNKAEEWLGEHNQTPSDLVWYLQIDSSEPTTCTITYDDSSYQTTVQEDKKISSGAGSCLSLSSNEYWLRVSPSCYEEEIEIQCHDSSFMTSLLFKKKTASTIYISSDPHSASAEGTTTEKVYSVCFGLGGTCDYEGSLWAALALDYLDYDITPYIPYLTTMADENDELLPEAFLYSLTGYTDFRVELLAKQKNSQYWQEDTNKFYDTAVALLPFQDDSPSEKSNSEEWLFDIQGSNGCWGSIGDTAFLLYSIWPDEFTGSDEVDVGDTEDCEDAGYYCMSSFSCQGELLSGYDCAGVQKCCDTPSLDDSCEDQGGEICGLNEECSISVTEAVDTSECCIGYCRTVGNGDDQSACEQYGGSCRTSCFDNEEQKTDECDSLSDVCCVEDTTPSPSYWWVWLLLILIILIIVGIIFRDKLRPYWLRLKSMFSKGQKSGPETLRGPRPRMPPPSSRIPFRRPVPRGVLPPQQRPQPKKPLPKKEEGSSEIDEVLKKLKDMGK